MVGASRPPPEMAAPPARCCEGSAARGAPPLQPRRPLFVAPPKPGKRCGGGPRRLRPCEALTLRCFFPGLRWRREGSRAEGAPVRGRAPRGGWCPTLWDGEGWYGRPGHPGPGGCCASLAIEGCGGEGCYTPSRGCPAPQGVEGCSTPRWRGSPPPGVGG